MLCSSELRARQISSAFASPSVCPKRRVTTASYQNGTPYGNTTSGQNRAALQQSIGASIDVSREAVTTQDVPSAGQRKSYRVSLFNAMKFYGPAPERINGRLAMIGFVLGALNEIQTGTPVLEQAQSAPVFTFAIAAIFTYASLVPIMKGARNEAFGFMTPKAELTNARAAMLGFAVLLYLENQAGASFF